MTEQGGFFNVQITDELIESLDNIAFAQLLEVLQLNFQQQYHQISSLAGIKKQLGEQIRTGQENLAKLAQIAKEHQRQKLKMISQLELLEVECEAAKKELKKQQ